MAQQQPSSMFEKPTDSTDKELTQQLHDANKVNKELEEKMDGLQEKLSIAEKEKLKLREVQALSFNFHSIWYSNSTVVYVECILYFSLRHLIGSELLLQLCYSEDLESENSWSYVSWLPSGSSLGREY